MKPFKIKYIIKDQAEYYHTASWFCPSYMPGNMYRVLVDGEIGIDPRTNELIVVRK